MPSISVETVDVPSGEEVRLVLSRVLSSAVFRGSRRCHDFLSYVCLKKLEGLAQTLKEHTIAIDVFGRSPSDDSGDDNIVRVGAREVRKRLALYYGSDGAEDRVRIELPTGSYVPVFRYSLEYKPGRAPEVAVPATEESAGEHPPAKNHHKNRPWIASVVARATELTALWIHSNHHSTAEFELFWHPGIDSDAPTFIVMPNPILYQPSSRALLMDERLNGKSELPTARAIKIDPHQLDGSDFVPIINQLVGFGDAVAAQALASVVEQRGGSVKLRLSDKLEFNDLYGASAVLIGGSFANRWTAESTKGLRYQFRFEDQSKPWLVDTQSDRRWGLSSITDDRRTSEDYILIARLPHAQTGKLMVIVGGLAVFGTEAGGRILSNPKLLGPVLQDLPRGWQDRNLQMVMKVAVVGEGPGIPTLIASHSW